MENGHAKCDVVCFLGLRPGVGRGGSDEALSILSIIYTSVGRFATMTLVDLDQNAVLFRERKRQVKAGLRE